MPRSFPDELLAVSSPKFGLHSTALVYSASLAVLVAVATGILLFGPGGKRARPAPSRPAPASRPAMPPGPCTGPPCPQAMGSGER